MCLRESIVEKKVVLWQSAVIGCSGGIGCHSLKTTFVKGHPFFSGV